MSFVSRSTSLSLALMLCAFFAAPEAEAQYFGRNKIEYVDFDFRVLKTEHFDVYFYPHEETAARLAARLAERWYARFARVLEHDLRDRQPLILYASQPEFAQTNVVPGFLDDGIGGVTESLKRRIVMPFAPTLSETDHILGHEIAHAFQFDVARAHGGRFGLPLWAIEGMAEYLSLGTSDAGTAMWLRDAARHKIPEIESAASRRFSPYRYGHALWAYLAGRFGDEVLANVLKAGKSGAISKRLRKVTGADLAELFRDWRQTVDVTFGIGMRGESGEAGESETEMLDEGRRPMLRDRNAGKLNLGPVLSPDGRRAVFFSEKDRLSVDLFLADTATGTIKKKLVTTAASGRFESLQPINSTGSWDWEGRRFVFAAIQHGDPALILLDVERGQTDQEIRFPRLGQILTPAWSPDGRTVAFSVLKGGFTDLYTYDLTTRTLRQLTADPFADLQPAWSPDGKTLAFATDRFSSDIGSLRFGPCELALIDVADGTLRPVPGISGARSFNPQWSFDGGSLYFLSNPDGTSNVYRFHLESGELFRITRVSTGVTGPGATNPALSVARETSTLAMTVYRRGRYEIDLLSGREALEGHALLSPEQTAETRLPPVDRAESLVDSLLNDDRFGLVEDASVHASGYIPNLSLEAFGQPYLSSGRGRFGTFVRGGTSVVFGDMLGERKLAAAVQVGNRLSDFALQAQYLNREARWNWGARVDVLPSMRWLQRRRITEAQGQRALTRETEYWQQTHLRVAGLMAYPLSRVQRLEFTGGVRYVHYGQEKHSSFFSLSTGRLLSEAHVDVPIGRPTVFAEAGAALVGDTAVFGPTGPILGTRYRFEITPAMGDLSYVRVLLDYRRYELPVKPYTIAVRVLHSARYGPDGNDHRLFPALAEYRSLVRGYTWSSLRHCRSKTEECASMNGLVGNQLLGGNFELRFPIRGMFSREINYGVLPAEAFIFADGALTWSQDEPTERGRRRPFGSVGVGTRINALGFILEVAAVRALAAPAPGWSASVNFRPGF